LRELCAPHYDPAKAAQDSAKAARGN
jgi:hypothetical protein